MTGGPLVAAMAVASVLGFALARRLGPGRADPLARRILRAAYWAGVFAMPPVLAAAPVRAVGLAVPLAIATHVTTFMIARAYARQAFRDAPEQAAFTLAAYWGNTGWLGLPVCVAVLGPAALPTATLYAMAVSAPYNLVVGATFAAARGTVGARAVLHAARRNHYLGPTLVAIAWSLAGLPVPAALVTAGRTVTLVSALPVMGAVGMVLAAAPLRPDRHLGSALAIRLGLSPALLALAALVVEVPRAFVVQAGMATGVNALMMAGEHRLPVRRIAPAIAWSTALVVVGAGLWVELGPGR